MPLFKTLLLPMVPRILNMQKGWMLNGVLLPEKEQKRVMRKKVEPDYIEDENPWQKALKLSMRTTLFILFFPVFIFTKVIDTATKGKTDFTDTFDIFFNKLVCLFIPKSQRYYSAVVRSKYKDAVWEDIPSFFDIAFERHYIVILYSTRWPTREEVKKLQYLKSNGFMAYFYVVKPPDGLLELTQKAFINRLNSKFILREADGFHVCSEDGTYDLETEAPDHTNVFLLRNKYANVPKYRVFASFYDFCRFTQSKFLSRKQGNLSPDYLFYIGRDEETAIDAYVKAYHDELVERYKEKGFTFLYYPIAKDRPGYFSGFQLDYLKYRMPRLYSMTDESIREFLSVLQLEITASDFYRHFVQELELPHFTKPALVRLLFRIDSNYPKSYPVYPFYRNAVQNPKEWFDFHIEKIKIYESSDLLYFQLEEKPEQYDADFYFDNV